MSRTSHEPAPIWLESIVALCAIGALALSLWRPGRDVPAVAERERKIEELGTLLGKGANPDAIDARLRAFTPFPPDPQASRALAEGLMMCAPATLDGSARQQLARQLYAITASDEPERAQPAALAGIQRAMVDLRCPVGTIEPLMRAARRVARSDPNPRRDWW